jgi:hypothetical protein
MEKEELIEKLEMMIEKLESGEWVPHDDIRFYSREIKHKNRFTKYRVSMDLTATDSISFGMEQNHD